MIVRTHRLAVWAAALLLAGPGFAAGGVERGGAGCDAAPVIASVTSNLRGPAGTMVVATGTLTLGGEVKDVKFAHYVSADGTEAFQGEDRGVNDDFLKKIRLIRRTDDQATMLLFVPSMRQGRKMRFKPTQSLFGSGEYHYYLLLPQSALERDYAFTCAPGSDDTVVLTGTRKPDAVWAPYPTVRLVARRRDAAWVVEEAACEGTADFAGFTQTFTDYSEVSPGAWAPGEIRLNGVHLRLTWHFAPAIAWMAGDHVAMMEKEDIP
jgi:hypothetical protein